jgi:hypothetical protein
LTPSHVASPRAVPRETAAEAIRALDAQFPWLAGAETQLARNHRLAPGPP